MRRGAFAFDFRGMPLGRMLDRVRGGDRFVFICCKRAVGPGHGMSVGMAGRPVHPMLSGLFGNVSMRCAVSGERVALGGMTRGGIRPRDSGEGAVRKFMLSGSRRPVAKTAVGVGSDAANTLASVRNFCGLRLRRRGPILVISFVKCVARRIGIKGGDVLGVRLRRSAGTLSRIMIATFNVKRGGRDLIKTVRRVHPRRLEIPSSHLSSSFTKHLSKIVTMRQDNRPKTSNTDF